MADGSEKRQHPRVRIPLLVQYRTSPLEPFRTDYASDISAGGIFLSETTPPLAPGATLFIQFVTRDGMHMVSSEATVVRKTADGNGMRFAQLREEDEQALRRLIEKSLEQHRGR